MLSEVRRGIVEDPVFRESSDFVDLEWLSWKAKGIGKDAGISTSSQTSKTFAQVSSYILREPLIRHSQLEGWVIHKKLGQGSYGSVYKATDPKGQVFALKLFPVNIKETQGSDFGENYRLDEEYTEWRLKEIWDIFLGLEEEKSLQVIKNSRDPTGLLMQSYAYGLTSFGGYVYSFAVIEYIEGTSLTSLIFCAEDTEWRPTQKVFEKFASVLFHGVSQLHGIGLAHLDINPNNIMFTGTKLKLVDFGFTCIFGPDRTCYWGQSTVNPPEFRYYSEQITRKQAEAVDVWCSAYSILSLLSIHDRKSFSQSNREDRKQNKLELEERIKMAKEKYLLPKIFLEAFSEDPTKRPTASALYREFAKLV